MEDKEIFGVIINLIVWPAIIYWVYKGHVDSNKQKKY